MSRFSVIESVWHLTDQYRSFIKSSYRLADLQLRAQFEAHVNGANVLVKGPYVTLSRDFAPGPTLAALLAQGGGHADLARLNWPFGRHPLFEHQARSLHTVEAGRNVVVKTGTGSGKTEAFLLPVLSGVLRLKEQGVQGTKAILLYPMNALANDQLQRLRELLRDSGTGITFALYTGDSETVVRTLGEPVEGHELIRKDDIRRHPPDIILTNYKQLEFLLVRKADRALFTRALRYVVLDEIHSYRGALATEVACLLRRLKARCGLQAGELRAIGTSATVSQDAGGDEALARFATDLFAESFEAADIVGEAYVPVRAPAATYLPPLADPDDAELAYFTHEDEDTLLRFAQRLTGCAAPAVGSTHARINAMLEGNLLLQALRSAAGTPRTLLELAEAVGQELGNAVGEKLIAAYLLLASFGDDAEAPLLRPKLHTFFHGVYDVGLCMNPGCRKLIAGGAESCPDCGSAVRPAVLCRTCGQDFVKVRFEPDAPEQTVANEDFLSDDHTAFITPTLVGERDDEPGDDDGDEGEDEAPAPRTRIARGARTGAARSQMAQQWIDHVTGRVFAERPDEVPSENLSLQHVLRRRGTTCPVCNSRYTRGDVLSLLRTGVASSVSVLGTHHLDEMPEDQRKLLVFADNRQDAAHQAGYMSDRQRQFALRHAIEAVVRAAGRNGIALQDLHAPVLEVFQKIGLAKRRLTRDEEAQWRKTIEYEVAGEFCRSSQQRISLENLALIEVQYEFLEQLVGEPKFVAECRRASLTPQQGGLLVRAILDFIRRRRAVSFDFYQRYLDPRRQPWSWLTVEPYNLSVSEHEKGATFFMFDRPEALRSRPVSGIKFDALVKDAERGAAGGVFRLLTAKVSMNAAVADAWIRNVVELMVEKEMLESPALLPETVQRHMGVRKALQVAKRIVRLVPASQGWRCQRCSIWRPYLGGACYASASCSGQANDLKRSEADRSNYYVDLYTAERPRRMKVLEHTAQIDQDERAKREQQFKQGQLEALVCSPTLELGVNIGDLYSVLMRNAPPGPANYVQRAGRAGRRLRIGFVSTFCNTGPHDRHCFEDPAWLVRGEFHPPVVRLSNDKIVARHVRSFALEELSEDFSWLMGDLLEDVQNPAELRKDRYQPLLDGLRAGCAESAQRAEAVFGLEQGVARVIEAFPDEIEATVQVWHRQVVRLHKEFHEFARIVSTRETEQKRRARMRAYQELTTDRERAFALTYLSEAGLLPSYQFPTDTFSLDPGVGDTPTLRRPAWIALFEFAPGNMVYANGHKLKSIRAFFDGGVRSTGGQRGADQSGRVESYCFCGECGFATAETVNTCPSCGAEIHEQRDVALIDSFEAEENTQITSSEDSRQRLIFERRENLLGRADKQVQLYPYEFATLEYQHQAQLLVTNWGRQTRRGQSDRFVLCPNCGRHKPQGLTPRAQAKWDEDHGRICNGVIRPFVLGYAFSADVLVLPVPARLVPGDEKAANAFCRTLGKALVVGAQEALEIEADEIAYFAHKNGRGGWRIVFYETAPGGAGYLEQLGKDLPRWALASHQRLFGHECERACYKCLKSSRNQFDHANLDKEFVRDVLFYFQQAQALEAPHPGQAGEGERIAQQWIEGLASSSAVPMADTQIERQLQAAISERGRLPAPQAQFEIRDDAGQLLTVPDFAYPERRIAIYCDGFAYHGNVDALSHDARKRNALQAKGWSVLVFWGRQIQRNPAACEAQVWQCFQFRRQV
ncbi:DEAD/DEAH box helicase [Pseudorhodoferax sp.]|uniref:DEAD/DEAH box helicase n=1 Tax=Pseudorhodoferax sp. TaxID=1993553 RepID=UPI002DD6405C|nr:DEAD/DEAH box helicase [Pseudorhodoferax sp.]